MRFTDLRDAEAEQAQSLTELWHFDPWWVLGEERYAGHGAVPALKRTNIAGYDKDVSGMWFDGTLEKATHVGKGAGESLRVQRFNEGTLAEIARSRSEAPSAKPMGAERSRAEWRLRPFWE